jgi:hypothetical protein
MITRMRETRVMKVIMMREMREMKVMRKRSLIYSRSTSRLQQGAMR